MPNRFIFSLRFSTKVFFKLGVLSLALVFFMTLFRINLYFLSVYFATSEVSVLDIFHSFITGMRFDILIFGFLFIPLYFLILTEAIAIKWPGFLLQFKKAYFFFAWLFICLITFVDFFYFARHGRHMRYDNYLDLTRNTFFEQFHMIRPHQAWTFVVISLLLLVLGLWLIKGLEFGRWKDEFSPNKGTKFEFIWRIIAPLMLIALAARGTVEPHHLALEHSEVSSNQVINEMALNAVWCFDK